MRARNTAALACMTMAAMLGACPAHTARADIYAGRIGAAGNPNIISRFSDAQSGNVAPAGLLGGAATGLQSSNDAFFETTERTLYIADFFGQSIRIFSEFAAGDTAPVRAITSPLMGQPRSLVVLRQFNELIVLNSAGLVTVPANANGNVAAVRAIFGATSQVDNAAGLLYLPGSDELLVGDYAEPVSGTFNAEVLVFPRTTNGSVAPTRFIRGDLTQLGSFTVDLEMNLKANELYVLTDGPTSGDPWRLVTFALNADGNVAPLRSISGSNTQIVAAGGMTYDSKSDQLIVANKAYNAFPDYPQLLVFPRTANGNVAPVKSIGGSNSGLANDGNGWYSVTSVNHDALLGDGFE